MPASVTQAQLRDTGVRRWRNWHENVDQPLHRLYDVWNANPDQSSVDGYNLTTVRLQGVIGDALAAGRSVRALGGGWSFTPCAATDGVLLNTRPLNYRFRLAGSAIHPNYQGAGRRPFFVQCGMSIAELNVYLASQGFALPTSGASNGQTIAGALSTCTHGAALAVGSIPDYVVGLHIVTGPGRSVWIERASYPVVSDTLIGAVGAVALRDDALFDAAVVSFGSFGLIHGLVIEPVPNFRLQAWRKRLALTAAVWADIANRNFAGLGLPAPPGGGGGPLHHFQMVINPFDQARGSHTTVMYRAPGPPAALPAGAKQAEPGGGIAQGDATLELIGRLTDMAGGLTGDLSKLLTKVGYKDYSNVCGTPGQMFRDTTTRGHAASAAMGVAMNHLEQAVDIACDKVTEAQAPALVAVRLVKNSRATLAFTKFAPVTAVVEIDGPDSGRVREAYRKAWRAYDAAGIAYTFHWGKLHDLDHARVRAAYGDAAVNQWLAARNTLLPTPELKRVFANDYTDRLGLSD